MGATPLGIRFDKIDGYIKIRDKIRNLVLFVYSYCDKICDKNLISETILLQIVLIIICKNQD